MKKMSQKNQVLISGIIVLFIAAVFCFMFIVQPLLKKIMQYNEEERTINAQMKNAATMTADKEKLSQEVEDIRRKIDYYEKRLPRETDVSQVLEKLIDIGKDAGAEYRIDGETSHGITFVSLAPLDVQEIVIDEAGNKGYLEIPIELKIKAGYHEFASFVNKIENFERFMRIDNIEIRSDETNPRIHNIGLTVSAFALKKRNTELQ